MTHFLVHKVQLLQAVMSVIMTLTDSLKAQIWSEEVTVKHNNPIGQNINLHQEFKKTL